MSELAALLAGSVEVKCRLQRLLDISQQSGRQGADLLMALFLPLIMP